MVLIAELLGNQTLIKGNMGNKHTPCWAVSNLSSGSYHQATQEGSRSSEFPLWTTELTEHPQHFLNHQGCPRLPKAAGSGVVSSYCCNQATCLYAQPCLPWPSPKIWWCRKLCSSCYLEKSVLSFPEGLNRIVLTNDTVNMDPSIIVIIQAAGYFLYHVLSAQGRSEWKSLH